MFQFAVLIINGAVSIRVGDSTSNNGPLVFTHWPPVNYNKPQSLRHQLLYHLRSNGRIPAGVLMKRYQSPQRVMHPLKMSAMSHHTINGMGYPVPSPSYYRPTISTPPRIHFQSSPPGPNSGEYIFENPFASIAMQPPPVASTHLNELIKKIV